MTEEDGGGGRKAVQKNIIIKRIKSFQRKEEVQFVRGWRSGAGRFKDASMMNRVPIVQVAPRGCSYAPKGVEKREGCIVHPA